MEINAANVRVFFFSEKLSFVVNKNGWEEKTNWLSCLQKKYKKLRTMPFQEQRNVRNENVQLTVRSHNFKYEHQDSTNSWRLRNKNNNFYLNVTQRLARLGGTKFFETDRRNVKKNLNVFLKRFRSSARKKDGTLSAELNPSKSRH